MGSLRWWSVRCFHLYSAHTLLYCLFGSMGCIYLDWRSGAGKLFTALRCELSVTFSVLFPAVIDQPIGLLMVLFTAVKGAPQNIFTNQVYEKSHIPPTIFGNIYEHSTTTPLVQFHSVISLWGGSFQTKGNPLCTRLGSHRSCSNGSRRREARVGPGELTPLSRRYAGPVARLASGLSQAGGKQASPSIPALHSSQYLVGIWSLLGHSVFCVCPLFLFIVLFLEN